MKQNPLRDNWRGVAAIVFVLLLPVAYYVARYHAWAAYREWRIASLNRMAAEFIEAGDGVNALLLVRRNLADRPNDIESSKLGVKAALLRDSVAALTFQGNLLRIEPNAENEAEMLRLALRFRAYGAAKDIVEDIKNKATTHADYHSLAAQYHWEVGQPKLASFHLISLLKLRPDDWQADIRLAEAELAFEQGSMSSAWRARVEALTAKPQAARIALRLLLQEALTRADALDAAKSAKALAAMPKLAILDRLLLLRALGLYAPSQFPEELANFRKNLEPKENILASAFAGTIELLNMPDKVIEWFEQLPTDLRASETIRYEVGRAYMAKADWNALLILLGGSPWRDNEDLRLTFLTAAHRELGHKSDATELWRLAVIATGQDARRVRRLLSTVESWRWKEERYSLLWELFNIAPNDVELRDELLVYEFSRGHTANLNKIYARLMQIAGSNPIIRNNFAYSSLLLDTNVASAHLHARAVFLESPQDPTFRTTYAFALYKQGEVQQAWDIMEGFALRDRPIPARIMLHSLFSAKLGKARLAEDLLNGLDPSTLLPEERQLVEVARREITRSDDTRGKETRLAALDGDGVTKLQGGWIELLPSKGPENPLVDMRLANSLYAKGDYDALGETLSARRWDEWEHIRVALLARVERGRSSGSAGVGLWRQAVVLAGIKSASLRDLEALARAWDWKDERMDVIARLYERDPSDDAMLNDLISYYRPRGRTHDVARLLWLRLGGAGTSGTTGKAADAPRCVYYSFLCQVEVSAAHTLAQRCHEDAPGTAASGVYGFSLWLQGRQDEAWIILKDLPLDDNTGVSIPLIQAMVLSDLGRHAEALAKLALVDLAASLPEEISSAEKIRSAASAAARKASP